MSRCPLCPAPPGSTEQPDCVLQSSTDWSAQLLASPVYDPGRCSIGFHPLHTALPIAAYVLALIHPKTRLLGLGLCIHILLDGLDCLV